MKYKKWLSQVRGIAIIAVVVCHMQGILHESELIQLLSLYSVSLFILCAGITKYYSLKKIRITNYKSVFEYQFDKNKHIISAYTLATIVYKFPKNGDPIDWNVILKHILSFDASPPFYFLEYYLCLSIVAPIFYYVICCLGRCSKEKKYSYFIIAVYLLLIFLYSYNTKISFWGGSYLFIYNFGLCISYLNDKYYYRKSVLWILGGGLFIAGIISVYRFYMARIGGNYYYTGGINKLTPKLQINPPNISIITYTLGIFILAYMFFSLVNKTKISVGFNFLEIMGKYSLDIFLWHLYILRYLNRMYPVIVSVVNSIWVKRIIYYLCMFYLPILFRYIYEEMCKKMSKELLGK